ncbi:serine/threonine protein kinase [Planomonospora parontospora]|uniref:serine/threonine protein kinase n=1 Tax=Planomonospora parontospora TaxID=58119 RepID=UPI00227D70E9|nr:serine/threonine-protein kinase [Planomonospora parontospora]
MEASRTIIGDRYELDGLPLGKGGMGEVYGGYDRQLDRRVAVKLIRFPYGQHDEALVKRFLHEARVMAKLEHPGAPAVYDAGVYPDPKIGPRPFMVMQFVEGVTVDLLVGEEGVLPVGWAAAIAAQIAAVLHAAHGRGVFHRDLKPSNLMLCPEGGVKVLDFGLAMFHDPEVSRLTRTGTTLGTPQYMSPEQVRGAAVVPQSDFYALGLVLHEMLTGERLFDGNTEYEILHRQVNETPPPVREQRPEVPEELDRFVLRLLAKRAEDRPAHAVEVRDALLPFVGELPPLPGTVNPGPSALGMYAQLVGRISGGTGAPSGASSGAAPGAAPPSVPLLEPAASTTAGGEGTDRAELDRALAEAAALAKEARYGQAVEVLSAVAKPATLVFGSGDDQVLALRLRLAEVLFEGGDYRRAAPAFGELHRDLADRYGRHDDRALHCRRQEATCQALLGETSMALELLKRLLVDAQAVYGRDDSRPLELRRQIGLLELGTGHPQRAQHTLALLLDDLTGLHGPDHPEVVKVRESLSRLAL